MSALIREPGISRAVAATALEFQSMSAIGSAVAILKMFISSSGYPVTIDH
jgi:hypothetical protein